MAKKKSNKPEDNQRPLRAYQNQSFLESEDARLIRVQCEILEPAMRFRRENVHNTIVVFGSAQLIAKEEAEKNLKDLKSKGADNEAIAHAERILHMSHYYHAAEDLSEKLTRWSMKQKKPERQFVICSGGGGGIMEAANKGAEKAGGRSIGLNIKIPTEQTPNPYITPELNFEFQYFFLRKFWFLYAARALVVFPGGLGTLDELFEVLTLMKTGKTTHHVPLILFGSDYWKNVINFDTMIRYGTMFEKDVRWYHYCDTVEDAYKYVTTELEEHYLNLDEEHIVPEENAF